MTSPYTLHLSCNLAEQIKAMPAKTNKKLLEQLHSLSVNPHPIQSHKVEGMRGLCRLYFEGLHILYRVEEKMSKVTVLDLVNPA